MKNTRTVYWIVGSSLLAITGLAFGISISGLSGAAHQSGRQEKVAAKNDAVGLNELAVHVQTPTRSLVSELEAKDTVETSFTRGVYEPSNGSVAGVGTCPNAGGFPASGMISQNTDTTGEGGTVACAIPAGSTTRQGWARCYDQATEELPAVDGPDNLTITGVSFNAGTVTTPPPGGIELHVNIYTLSGNCPAPGSPITLASATLKTSASVLVVAGDLGTTKTATFAPGVVIANGVDFVVEIEQVEDGTVVPTFAFRPGENFDGECLGGSNPGAVCTPAGTECLGGGTCGGTNGQCAPNYIRGIAGACGITNWTDMSTIGSPPFRGNHLIQVLAAAEGGATSTCGNSVVEGGEDCDPPGTMCSPQCQSPGSGIGACCNGIACTIQLSSNCVAPNIYIGDSTDCTSNSCAVGACCMSMGQTCRDKICSGGTNPGAICDAAACGGGGTCTATGGACPAGATCCAGGTTPGALCCTGGGTCPAAAATGSVPLATCTTAGGMLNGGQDCTPACCLAPTTGTDSCEMQAPVVIPVPGSRTYSGDNSGSSVGDSCGAELNGICVTPTSYVFGGTLVGCAVDADCAAADPMATCSLDRGWFESFTINGCANVTVDFCCTTADVGVAYGVLYPACPCASGILRDAAGFGTGPVPCPDGSFSASWNDLPAGTYRLPIFSAPIPSQPGMGLGPYEVHIKTAACAVGRCCNGGVCTANVDQTTCTNGGGFWGGPNSICFPAGVCGTGACCVNETCRNRACVGGTNAGNFCLTVADCPGGTCTGTITTANCTAHMGDLFPGQSCLACAGGPNPGIGCNADADCGAGGTCTTQNVICPPSNNDCADATVITNGSLLIDTVGATTDGPANLDMGCVTSMQINDDVWFRYDATCNGNLTVSTCDGVPGSDTSNFDTVIAVYNGVACPPAAAPIGCDDDGCLTTGAGGGSLVTVAITAGQSYLIRVGGFAAGNEGQAVLTLTSEATGGGCCNPAGTCADVAGPGNCLAPNEYHPGVCCKDINCNVYGSCDWDNGPGDPFGTAYASQYSPKGSYAEGADDFNFHAITSAPPCKLDAIQWWVRLADPANGTPDDPKPICDNGICQCPDGTLFIDTNPPGAVVCPMGGACVPITEGTCSADHQFCFQEDPLKCAACVGGTNQGEACNAPADCLGGGVCTANVKGTCDPVTCTNSPADWFGIRVAIYNDATVAGNDKMAVFSPAVAIPDCDGLANTPAVDSHVIAVNNPPDVTDCNNIIDLDVALVIDHTFVGDLVVDLSHNNGINTVTSRLLSRVGAAETPPGALCTDNSPDQGDDSNNVNIVLDDEATFDVESGPFPLAGGNYYRPNPGVLSAFDGRSKCGTWTITVHDGEELDTGTLVQWALHFNNTPSTPKGPTGQPVSALVIPPDGTHTGVVKNVFDVLPGQYVFTQYVKDGQPVDHSWEINMTVPPGILIDQNKKNWIAIAPIWPAIFYRTFWMTSQKPDVEHDAQTIFKNAVPPDLIPDWLIRPGDGLAFRLSGTKQMPTGCPCTTDADCRSPGCAADNACNCASCQASVCVFTCSKFGNVNCDGGQLVNLDDILYVLGGFANFANFPNADINPCGGNGVVNLDDILAVLQAFAGANLCGCQPAGTPDLCGSSMP